MTSHIMGAMQEQEERDQLHHGKDSLVKESTTTMMTMTAATNPFFTTAAAAAAEEEDDLTTEQDNIVMDSHDALDFFNTVQRCVHIDCNRCIIIISLTHSLFYHNCCLL